jgi:CHAT domain-containing protein
MEKFNYFSIYENYKASILLYQVKNGISEKKRLASFAESDLISSNNLFEQVTGRRIIGDYQKSLGNFINARNLFLEGIAIIENNKIEFRKNDLKNNGTSILDIYEDLASLYADLGNKSEAITYYNQAIQKKAQYSKDDLFVIPAKIGKAMVLSKSVDIDQSISTLNELLKESKGLMTNKLFYEANFKLTKLYSEKGDYKNALKSAEETKKMSMSRDWMTGIDRNKLRLAMAENLIAEVYINQDNLSQGAKYVEKAEQTFKSKYTTDLVIYSDFIRVRALLYFKQGNYQQANEALDQLINKHIDFIDNNFSSLSQIEKEKLYSQINKDLNLYYNLSIEIYNKTQNPKILTAVFNARLKTKGFILNDQNKILRTILQSDDEALKAKVAEWQGYREELAYILFKDPQSEMIDSLNSQINLLERSISESVSLIDRGSQEISLSNVKHNLSNNDYAVEMIRYSNFDNNSITYAALILNKEWENCKLVDFSIDVKEERRLTNFYKTSIKFEIEDTKSYLSMWQEIDRAIDNPDRVFFSPDGMYYQLNLNTLKIQETEKYVIDNYQVVNMTNLKDLLNVANRNKDWVAYLFGRPQYDYNVAIENMGLGDLKDTYRSNLFMELESFQEQKFADLPGTESEIIEIDQTLRKDSWQTKLFLGPQATEYEIKQLNNANIIHIATHGFFINSEGSVNPMIKSGLVMAGINNGGNASDDGVLTAYEASNLQLDKTWLVVLSACETGLGDIKNGEGVYGLQRALTIAGAQNLMMTLWKVDDQATKELMSYFYSQLSSLSSIEEAFRNSQLTLRKKYPHPKFWGSFVLTKSTL